VLCSGVFVPSHAQVTASSNRSASLRLSSFTSLISSTLSLLPDCLHTSSTREQPQNQSIPSLFPLTTGVRPRPTNHPTGATPPCPELLGKRPQRVGLRRSYTLPLSHTLRCRYPLRLRHFTLLAGFSVAQKSRANSHEIKFLHQRQRVGSKSESQAKVSFPCRALAPTTTTLQARGSFLPPGYSSSSMTWA
jgi:hypothetical protein